MLFPLLRLIINDSQSVNMNTYFNVTKCYDLSEMHTISNGMVPKTFDEINEFFVHITLPELDNGSYWKDNLLLELIESIKITTTTYMGFNYQQENILFSKNDIVDLITNKLNNFNDILLFRNLNITKRKKLSCKQITLILPLKLENMIVQCIKNVEFKIDFNYDNLIEYHINTNFKPIINWKLQMYGCVVDSKILDAYKTQYYT